jgi:hypothetical protein
MAYLYRHIRLDKNEPFYIGIGSDSKYRRAFEKGRRNKVWNDIVNKTDYEVEILMDGLSWEQACEKEKEFISIYGRKNINNGTLANLTDGGEGALNRIYVTSEETKRKLSIAHTGKKYSEDQRKMFSEIRKGIKLSEKHIQSLKEAAKKRDYKKQGKDCVDKILKSMNVSPILVYKDGEFIGEFINRVECRNKIGISKTMLYSLIRGEIESCKGYKIKIK